MDTNQELMLVSAGIELLMQLQAAAQRVTAQIRTAQAAGRDRLNAQEHAIVVADADASRQALVDAIAAQ